MGEFWLQNYMQIVNKRKPDLTDRVLEEVHAFRSAGIEIILPVYAGTEATENCIRSVLACTHFPFHITIINDASPEENMQSMLEKYEGDERISLILHEENRGFVRTVNEGMRLTGRSVVLLNSDTQVPDGWLERLVTAAAHNPKAATVTPYSSNSGIFTLFSPDITQKYSYEQLADAVRVLFDGSYLKIPTGNGFCMFIRRSALDAVGLFDEETYERGYGEENDFCMRCARAGFMHVLDPSCYIRHIHHLSFGAEAENLAAEHRKILCERFPEYDDLIDAWKRDPGWGRKKKLLTDRVTKYLASGEERKPVRDNFLVVMHAGKGGSVLNRLDLMHTLSRRYNCYFLTGNGQEMILEYVSEKVRIPVKRYHLKEELNFNGLEREDMRNIYAEIIGKYRITYVNMSHLLGNTFDLLTVCHRYGVPAIYVLHDYYTLCPSFALLDPDNRCCEGSCTAAGRPCRLSPTWIRKPSRNSCEMLPVWRLFMNEYLQMFDAVCAPSSYTARIAEKVYPELSGKVKVIEHGRDFPVKSSWKGQYPSRGEKIRILILGNIGVSKGIDSLLRLAELDTKHRLEIHVAGDISEKSDRIICHGQYDRGDVPAIVDAIRPHYGLIPSIFPETYCHTLTECWAMGLPVVAFNVGVPADRIRNTGAGWLAEPGDAAALYALFTSGISEMDYVRKRESVDAVSISTVSRMANQYAELLESLKNTEKSGDEVYLEHEARTRLMNDAGLMNSFSKTGKKEKVPSGSSLQDQKQNAEMKAEISRLKEKLTETRQLLKHDERELDIALNCTRRQIGDVVAESYGSPVKTLLIPAKLVRLLKSDRERKRIAAEGTAEARGKACMMPQERVLTDSQKENKDGKRKENAGKVVGTALTTQNRPTADAGGAVSVIVCVHNARKDVENCLASLLRCRTYPYEIIIVDDGSEEETRQFLGQFMVKQEENGASHFISMRRHEKALGYTISANEGIRSAAGEYIVLLNSDTVVTSDWAEKMILGFEADNTIGVLSPLSSAATWQSVPVMSDANGWVINALSAPMNEEVMNQIAAHAGKPLYPHLICVNGFCFMIRRRVIETIGLLDEETFPRGYGEEVDYCLRAEKVGYKCCVLDDTYIYHAKTKSFTGAERSRLNENSYSLLRAKHGKEYDELAPRIKANKDMQAVRERFVKAYDEAKPKLHRLANRKIAFLLPAAGGSGGANSVCQEVFGLRRMGLDVVVLNEEKYRVSFEKFYPFLKDCTLWYEDELPEQWAAAFDLLVCTIFLSVPIAAKLKELNPQLEIGYYVQDYEPMFFNEYHPLYKKARESYELIPGAHLFAKTDWIVKTVEENHPSVRVSRVRASLDRMMYNPFLAERSEHGQKEKITITAMVRPSTPRRRPAATLQLLMNLSESENGKISVNLFGCTDEQLDNLCRGDKELNALTGGQGSAGVYSRNIQNYGILTREEVSALMKESDLFLDLSSYQAFGRTGLEAMACGCVPVLPSVGGVYEYALDGENSLIVDTMSIESVLDKVLALVKDREKMMSMRIHAIETAKAYSVMDAAWSEAMLAATFF